MVLDQPTMALLLPIVAPIVTFLVGFGLGYLFARHYDT